VDRLKPRVRDEEWSPGFSRWDRQKPRVQGKGRRFNMKNRHHPPHIYLDDTWYMLTASTYCGIKYLTPDCNKNFFVEYLDKLARSFDIALTAWVVLDNHYHLLFKSHRSTEIPVFIKQLHGRTSFEFNRLVKTRGRQVWHNYWDTLVRTEIDYWKRFNYIHNNPIKHGYVRNMFDWPYSSFRRYLAG
jgi:putative transposase